MAVEEQLIRDDIEAYLNKYQQKELLRFVAVGSVDDGKSTLIGRLLHDTGMVYEDQLDAVKRASAIEGEEIDFSLFTDGLKAEREQGITIDVAYRYFATETRKFIIADTPGHIQYTRNMVTGASTANVALILIDARLGVLQQSRRHAYIASLLGIPHLAVCINKMDLVDYDKDTYEKIQKEFNEFTAQLSFKDVTFFPVSALKGVNIVSKSEEVSWYEGPTVLQYLEQVPIAEDRNLEDFRFPVQFVLRPNLNYRGFSGEIASGQVKLGDKVRVLSSQKTSTIKSIDTFDGELDEAHAPQAVTLRLEDEIDISRGDVLVHEDSSAQLGNTVQADLVWMSETDMDSQKSYLLKQAAQVTRVQIDEVKSKKDMDNLEDVSAGALSLNDIGQVQLTSHRPLCLDAYKKNRRIGAFILIDSLTNNTVAAGMIQATDESSAQGTVASLGEHSLVGPSERKARWKQQGCCIGICGSTAKEQKTFAYLLERKLFDLGHLALVFHEEPVSEVTQKTIIDSGVICLCVGASKCDVSIDISKVLASNLEEEVEVWIKSLRDKQILL